jgi:hypothetical protein
LSADDHAEADRVAIPQQPRRDPPPRAGRRAEPAIGMRFAGIANASATIAAIPPR